MGVHQITIHTMDNIMIMSGYFKNNLILFVQFFDQAEAFKQIFH